MRTFEDAGDQLRQLADAMAHIVLAPIAPLWRSGSQAAREAREDATYAGPWGGRPMTDAIKSGMFPLELAHDHLLGMAALLPLPDVMTAPITLSRTVSTACARSHWQLDPSADARERLRRSVNVSLESLAERAQLFDSDSESYVALAAEAQTIVDTASHHGFAVKTERPRHGGSWRLHFLDDKVPSEMALARQLHSTSSRFANSQFRLGSAAVHAQAHGLALLNLAPGGPGPGGILRVDLAALAAHTAGAVLAVFKAGLRALEFAGVPTYRWERVGLPILQAWEQGMRKALPGQ